MTQKELLYVEDAVNHEKDIIAIVNDTINNLEDIKLVKFLKKELNNHMAYKNELLKLLEEMSNE
ncbi:MAG: hypothetical protein IJ568_01370 [Bacilli bacterium]|nr:hypothetical protein [Bacilli bacterium]